MTASSPWVRTMCAPAPTSVSLSVVSGPMTAPVVTSVAPSSCVPQDRHILTDRDIDVDPRGVRVDDGDSGAHELLALAAVELLAQVGQLDAVVRSFDLPQIAGDGGRHRPAGLTGEADDIGEVLLSLGVVGRQGR